MNRKSDFQLYCRRLFFLRGETDQWLSLSTLFGCLLVLARIIYTGRLTFILLPWNLFLAYIPYLITKRMSTKSVWTKRKAAAFFLFIIWMLCIPNSFYIITDLFHLNDQQHDGMTPGWYDLALILSFAWTGLLLGILSVRQMEKMAQQFFPGRHELIFLYPVMLLNALGIYVGRYLRFNSWDVLTNPFQLGRDIADILLHPLIYRFAWGMIICFSILMTLMYLTIKKISKTIR
jgi:uncharacterized membrane protein